MLSLIHIFHIRQFRQQFDPHSIAAHHALSPFPQRRNYATGGVLMAGNIKLILKTPVLANPASMLRTKDKFSFRHVWHHGDAFNLFPG